MLSAPTPRSVHAHHAPRTASDRIREMPFRTLTVDTQISFSGSDVLMGLSAAPYDTPRTSADTTPATGRERVHQAMLVAADAEPVRTIENE